MNEDSEHLEIIRDFVVEGREILESLDPSLMTLENQLEMGDELDRDLIHEIFRGFHSIKGAAGFLEFESISKVTHQAESLLDLFRKEKAKLLPRHLELFYQAADLLGRLIGATEKTLSDDGMEEEVDTLVDLLVNAMPGGSAAGGQIEEEQVAEIPVAELNRVCETLETVSGCLWSCQHGGDNQKEMINRGLTALQEGRSILTALKLQEPTEVAEKLAIQIERMASGNRFDDRNLIGILNHLSEGLKQTLSKMAEGQEDTQSIPLLAILDDLAETSGDRLTDETELMFGRTLVHLGVISTAELDHALGVQEKPLGEILLDMKAIDRDQLDVGLKLQQEKKKKVSKTGKSREALTHSIRVDLNKLELMGNLVGELVIAENMVTHHESVDGDEFESFHKAAQVLNRISRDIQDLVMSLRMVPVQASFQKLTRVIRDVSHKIGKKVAVNLVGEDTEIDKNVIENLSSPLVHLVRNAVDHGLELPVERAEIGKAETGCISLEASQEGGEILIRIRDDGRGINKERVLGKALERGLIEKDQVPTDDEEIYALILLPGFSTVEKITEVSGRGVGMDVVKKNLEDLQGSIGINSDPGKGTTFTLRIPLTLSIIEGMLVRIGRAVITVPLLSIRESIVIKNQKITRTAGGSETIMIRGSLIPVIKLSEFLGLSGDYQNLEEGVLVIVEYGRQNRCLFVDEIIGQRQTVIKRVSGFFGDLRGVSGFSILSNGDITLVLDVAQVIRLS